jgi:heptosyltransferase-3
MWTEGGWRQVASWLNERGIAVVVTGGPHAAERAYVDALFAAKGVGIVDLVGKLAFPDLAALIAGAAVYVGPDTVASHLAAATGTPTVALFGPSNPVVWGPWPRAWRDEPSPYVMRGTQLRGNVALVQGTGDCVPCLQEGCQRHVESDSKCLLSLPAAKVIDAIEVLLGSSQSRSVKGG